MAAASTHWQLESQLTYSPRSGEHVGCPFVYGFAQNRCVLLDDLSVNGSHTIDFVGSDDGEVAHADLLFVALLQQ